MRTLLLTALALLTLPACLLTPNDGSTVANTTAPITFQGMHLQAGAQVRVQAWDFAAGRYAPLATATSRATGYAYSDATVYPWVATTTLGPQFWERGSRGLGAKARVKAVTTGTDGAEWNMMSTTSDWGTCFEANGNSVGAFARECAAPNSPDAVITTSDYCAPADDRTYNARSYVFYDRARRRLGFGVDVSSYSAAVVSPSVSLRLYRADNPTANVFTNVDCGYGPVHSPPNRYNYQCFTNAISVPDACAFNDLINSTPRQVRVEAVFTQQHPCHRGTVRYDGSAGGFETCTPPPPPPPPPPPETRPDLRVEIASNSGIFAPITLCNNGPGVFTGSSELMISTQGSSQASATYSNVAPFVPRLEVGACVLLGDAFVGITSGTGGGYYLASSSTTACADTSLRVDEASETNNCTTRTTGF